MITLPPYLKKGDTIGIVAPAGFMPLEKMETCVNTLQDWGYTVKLGATTHSNSSNYFSGTDEERLRRFLEDNDTLMQFWKKTKNDINILRDKKTAKS